MKKLFIILCILWANLAYSQGQSDSIIVKKGFSTVFMQNNVRLTPRDLLMITQSNPEAYALMQKAKSNSDFANVFSFAGGFLIGWPLGTSIGGGEPNWTLAAIGAGLFAVAIPLSISFTKNATRAVDIYNSSLEEEYFDKRKISFNLGVTSQGVGLVLNF